MGTTGRRMGMATRRGMRLGAVTAVVGAALFAMALLGALPAGAAAYSNDQWALQVIGAPTAWQYGTGAGIKIGIVDTGVDTSQQDLVGKVVAGTTFLSDPSSGCDTAAQDPNGEDDNGHGTHVAGIAAASGQYGVTGVAPGASLVVAKVLDCDGTGEYSDVVDGIDWVVQHGAKVINLSLGDSSIGGLIDPSQIEGSPLGTALQDAWNAGVIPVIAGGNNGGGAFGLGDANYSGIPAVVVAATGSPANDEQDELASYSNSIDEAEWGVAAPGGDDPNGPSSPTCGEYDPYEILSTYWWGPPTDAGAPDATTCYATDEGTSMAAPFVTGTLADLLGHGLSPTQAVQTLLDTTDHDVPCGSDCSGLINAGAAMEAAAAASPPATKGLPTSAPAGTTTTRPAGSGAIPAVASTSTSAVPISTTSPTGGTTSTTTKPDSPVRTAALGSRGDGGAGSQGGSWWLSLPIMVGLAAAALGLGGRRWWVLRHATVHRGDGGGQGLEPWTDWPSTN